MGRSITSLVGTAKQSDAPSVRQSTLCDSEPLVRRGLFVERCSENEDGTHQTQPLGSGAGGRDRTGMSLLSPRDFKSLASAYFATPAAGAAVAGL